jgi:glucose-1-phosphate thymidylyltransferase
MKLKGVILAGGNGSRLYPMTKIINKSLLPVYDKPMIYYALKTLKQLGCEEIMIVSGRKHSGQIMSLLGAGFSYEDEEYDKFKGDVDVALTYRVQERPGGIAQALGICKNFIGNDNVAVCLADNIFEDDFSGFEFKNGAHIFLKSVPDPERFGVAEVAGDSVVNIIEKPTNPVSDLCVTGLYVYDSYVWTIIDNLEPSGRGELEITDVNNWYVKNDLMKFNKLDGFWSDAGTPDSLAQATELVKNKREE